MQRHFAWAQQKLRLALYPIITLSLLGSCLGSPLVPVCAQGTNSDQETGARESEEADSDDGWTFLFDGTSLDAFRGYAHEKIGAGWKIEDGALVFDGKSGGGDIITRDRFADFELRFEWKISPGGNSGVMYRVSLGDPATYFSGPEYQILDDSAHHDGRNSATSAAALYGLYVPQNKRLQPVGEWNTARIVVDGNRVEHWLNGEKVVQAEIGSKDWNRRVEASKFKAWNKFGKNRQGHIAFQDHGNRVSYRNIRIRKIQHDD